MTTASRSSRLRTSHRVWPGAILAIVGLGALGISSFQLYQDRRFEQEGRSTSGAVVRKSIRISDSRDRDGTTSRTTHYDVTYTFTADGSTVEGRDEVSQERYASLAEGDQVDVLYLPNDPSSNRLAGPRPWFVPVLFIFVGLAFVVIGGVISARAVRDASLEARFREHGVRARGTVTGLQARALTVDEVQQWRLHYEYQDMQGERHASVEDMDEDDVRQWKVGDACEVLYDPSAPSKAVWLGRESDQ